VLVGTDNILPSVISTGRYVAFVAVKPSPVSGQPGAQAKVSASTTNSGYRQVFIRDTCLGATSCTAKTTRISLQPGDGMESGAKPTGPALSGDANHVIYSGGIFNDMLGGGDRIEIVTLGGKTYLKGSNLFGTADASKWYYLAESAISKPPFDLNDLIAQTGDDLDKAKIIGSESVDGQACQQWLADFKNEAGALIDAASTDETRSDFNTLDSAEARFVRCPDNFVHSLTWSVQAHNSQNANQKGSVSVSIHLFDFGASNISISAPADAIELR